MKRRVAGVAIAATILAACAAERAQDVTPSAVPPPSGNMGQPQEPPHVVRERAKTELKQAEIELSAAGSDCDRACKALASMDRATSHLCSVASTPDEQQSCDDAKQKLQTSRDRVRGTCGECTR